MAKYSSAAALAALVSTTYAAVCQNITIPVNISARNGVFNVTNPTNNIESTNFALRMARQGNNYTQESLTGYNTVSGSYEIEATYCKPDSGSSKVLQILTHGIGFDRSYWNLPFNNYNYSYTSVAVDQYGYDTLAIDRLGIGQSTLFTDPIQEGQLWLEVAALAQVTMDARNGQVGGMECNAENFVHVGHSFGSAITYTLTSMYPNITDGQILTGFSQNGSFASQFILGSNLIIANQISALSQYTTGYLAPNAVEGVQIDFFAPGDFDPNILTYAYMTGQPVTPGEILTLTGATAKPNTFSGPSLVITGEHDTPYCGGDCYATGNPALASIPAASAMFLPNASPFEAFIVPGAGHGLNLQYTHPITYQTMLNFLTQNGLASN